MVVAGPRPEARLFSIHQTGQQQER
jgi:hypothetical protein